VDLWLLGFSFVFGVGPVLVWAVFDVFWGLRLFSLGLILFLFEEFLTCFGVSVVFRCVLVGRKDKWEWIVGFGEDQVSFGWFSWELLSFCCFFF